MSHTLLVRDSGKCMHTLSLSSFLFLSLMWRRRWNHSTPQNKEVYRKTDARVCVSPDRHCGIHLILKIRQCHDTLRKHTLVDRDILYPRQLKQLETVDEQLKDKAWWISTRCKLSFKLSHVASESENTCAILRNFSFQSLSFPAALAKCSLENPPKNTLRNEQRQRLTSVSRGHENDLLQKLKSQAT